MDIGTAVKIKESIRLEEKRRVSGVEGLLYAAVGHRIFQFFVKLKLHTASSGQNLYQFHVCALFI